jgi:hypothetical protein
MTGFTTFNFGVIAGGGAAGGGGGTSSFPGIIYFLAVGGGGGGVGPAALSVTNPSAGGGGGGGGVVTGLIPAPGVSQVNYAVSIGSGGSTGYPSSGSGTPTTITGGPVATPVTITALGGGGAIVGCKAFSGGSGGGTSSPFGVTPTNQVGGCGLQPSQAQVGITAYINYGFPGSPGFSLYGGAGGSSLAPWGISNPTRYSAPIGITSSITGTACTYGGGGSSAGASASPGIPGGTNTGNGGGGTRLGPSNPGLTAGSGGPGIVVISYVNPVAIATGGTISNTTTGLVPGCIMQVHKFTSPGTFTLNTFTKPSGSYPVSILVVGGGGRGGYNSPVGGGAGGGGGVVVASTCVTKGCGYVINSATGGIRTPSTSFCGQLAQNSFIAGPGLLLTALGGGAGGIGYGPAVCSNAIPSIVSGQPGGSGGGAGLKTAPAPFTPTAGTALQPGQAQTVTGAGSTFTNYGFNGGAAGGTGGGGGGATRAGFNATAPGTPGPSGGTGYSFPYTGVLYGGGGDNVISNPATQTNNGSGGGGAYPAGVASNGTGGGGGNSAYPTSLTSAGAPGTVIIVVPTPNFPGVAVGATISTPCAAPGKTVLTYNQTPSPLYNATPYYFIP